MSFLSPVHILFFAAIALLALGPKRFPEFTRTLGNTVREFRAVMNGGGGIRDLMGEGGSRVQADDAAVEAPAPLSVAVGETSTAPEPPPTATGDIVIAPPPAP